MNLILNFLIKIQYLFFSICNVGIEYEYTIENLNEVRIPTDIEDLRRQSLAIDKQLSMQTRELLVAPDF